MLKYFFLFVAKVIVWLWNWIGKIILLFVKFFFWIWGAILASILIIALSLFLLSHGLKAFDQTEFSKFVITQMEMDMAHEYTPEIDIVLEDVDFDILEE